MSLREEQCKKVCRILDDVLANRPTERDSLIVAVQLAFKSLSEPHWIPVTERLPEEWNTTYLATIDHGEYGTAVGTRFFFGDNIGWNDKAVIAWMPLPKAYRGE